MKMVNHTYKEVRAFIFGLESSVFRLKKSKMDQDEVTQRHNVLLKFNGAGSTKTGPS